MTAEGTARPPLRIAMIIPYDPYYQPFVVRSIRFAEELVRRGHHVHMLYRPMRGPKRGNPVRSALPEGIRVERIRRTWLPTKWRHFSRIIGESDIVHFQKSLPPASILALVFGHLNRKPIHQDWDDDEFAFWYQALRDALASGDLPMRLKLRTVTRRCLALTITGSTEWMIPKVVDTVGGASMWLRRKSHRWGCDRRDIFAARVGVDCDQFQPGCRDEALRAALGLTGPTVLYAGSFDVGPDIAFFSRALRVMVAQVPAARCLVVGGGFGRDFFVRKLRETGLEHAVTMTDGLVPFADMPRYVASCDIAALPFRDTPVNRSKSSLTLVECMASGLPAVTHDVGDIGWMLGDGGVLSPPDDAERFGFELAALARDSSRRTSLGQRARQRAQTVFSWEKTVDNLEAAYYHALSKRARKRRALPLTGAV